MLKLKKTAVAVLAFGSSAVFAGTMGPVCSPGNVTVPCERTAWDFGGQGLYLNSSMGGLGSLFYQTAANATGGTDYNSPSVDDKWGWGFKLEASYHFGTGNDVNLNWYHLGNSRNEALTGTYVGLQGQTYTGTTNASLKPRWDMANLELAQHVDFSQVSYARVHGGLSYSRIANKVVISNAAASGLPSGVENSTFNGFGPRAGADLGWGFGNGLDIYAKAAMALYAGSMSANASHTAATGIVTNYVGLSSTKVVPELEGKLGGTYTYSMAQGDLSLDAGWMWNNYFEAVARHSSIGHVTTANFNVQGPFVGLKWVGNVV